MTMLNTAVRIQDKSGSSVVPDVSLAGFWAMLAPSSLADPRLVYDSSVSRWYATVIADFRSPTSAVFLAVSASSDPTGVWSFYSIEADPAGLLWAARRHFRSNTALAARISATLEDLYREFGLKARLAAPLVGRYLRFAIAREERRLRRGWTYEPPLFRDVNTYAAAF
ncbi:MAG: hypothetical protein IID33_17380, partial [Planctomycetes bacterium]|nr:hypothetical protein [Planctomycetota bacterium]